MRSGPRRTRACRSRHSSHRPTERQAEGHRVGSPAKQPAQGPRPPIQHRARRDVRQAQHGQGRQDQQQQAEDLSLHRPQFQPQPGPPALQPLPQQGCAAGLAPGLALAPATHRSLTIRPAPSPCACRRLRPRRRALGVDVQHPHPNRVPLAHHVARMQKAALGQFGDVDQALQALFHADKGAKTHHVGHRPFDDLADPVASVHAGPGVGAQAFQAQGDAPFLRIHAQHMDVDLLAGPEYVLWMAHPVPRKLRDVDQALRRPPDPQRRQRWSGW